MILQLTSYHGGQISVNFTHVVHFQANPSGGTQIQALGGAKAIHVTESYAQVTQILAKGR